MLAVLLLLGSCESRELSSCSLSGAPQFVGEAVCTGDADMIRLSLAKVRALEIGMVATALLRIWLVDTSAGTSLPWTELTSQSVRLAYAPFLSQSIRNGMLDYPLESFQQFAREVALRPKDESERVKAIYLLGIADADSEIGYLSDVIRQNPYPAAAHVEGIRSLARMCDPRAADELAALERSLGQNDPEAGLFVEAVKIRGNALRAWCRR